MPARSLLVVTLFVSDVDTSAIFFRALGVGVTRVDTQGPIVFAEGGIDRTAVLLWPATERAVTRLKLGFRVDSIAEVAAALDRLGAEYELPEPRPHLIRTKDPDGNQIHLVDVG